MADLGFLGGGQLARMSIQAAQRMGLRCLSLDPAVDTPASQIAPALQGSLEDPEALARVLAQSDRVTLENEFVPAAALRQACDIAKKDPSILVPGIDSLATIQDKLLQRQAYARAGVPSPRAVEAHLGEAEIGFPMVLKARFGGYDGKGTRTVRTPDDLATIRHEWKPGGWLAETFVPFTRELAVMVHRSPTHAGCFPTMETLQRNHVCDLVFPADRDASEVALAAVEAVEGYGLFGVELFELQNGEIWVNEIAPRPHNSGHYTLDWGGISQFEQHVRLAMAYPTQTPNGQPAAMANLLGIPRPGDWRNGLIAALGADPGVHVHWYGKAESRPGRKMGHLNAVGANCRVRAEAAREAFILGWLN